ncbi:hypothetical protein FRC07_010627 [Ceratobasidium sp. 392]|nr:hypothetical protein FRC07_010627 [Ceratobasidium sp. 392]
MFSRANHRSDSGPPNRQEPQMLYAGPLSATFRNLKIFSLSSLTLASALTPFIFIIEAPLTLSARIALAVTALGTSWCGKSYVISMRRLPGSDALEFTTTDTFLRERRTTVFSPQFLQPTSRLFATWELSETFTADAEPGGKRLNGSVETVAVTRDSSGSLLGQWEIEWHEESGRLAGTVRKSGHTIRYFNVHEELLNSSP